MNSYKDKNYCIRCKKTFKKTETRCDDCNQKVRTRPKGQYGKKHPELVRI